jgi:hypothetical protein
MSNPKSTIFLTSVYLNKEIKPSTYSDLIRECLNLDFLKPLITIDTPIYKASMWVNKSHQRMTYKTYYN